MTAYRVDRWVPWFAWKAFGVRWFKFGFSAVCLVALRRDSARDMYIKFFQNKKCMRCKVWRLLGFSDTAPNDLAGDNLTTRRGRGIILGSCWVRSSEQRHAASATAWPPASQVLLMISLCFCMKALWKHKEMEKKLANENLVWLCIFAYSQCCDADLKTSKAQTFWVIFNKGGWLVRSYSRFIIVSSANAADDEIPADCKPSPPRVSTHDHFWKHQLSSRLFRMWVLSLANRRRHARQHGFWQWDLPCQNLSAGPPQDKPNPYQLGHLT